MGIPVPFRINGGLAFGKDNIKFDVLDFPPATGDGKSDAMAFGSIVICRSNGLIYRKTTMGSGADKWTRIADATDKVGAVHWKHPVRVVDTQAKTQAQFETFMNQFGMIGGTNVISDVGETNWDAFKKNATVLLPNISGGFGEGRYMATAGFAMKDISDGGESFYLVATECGPAGNNITLAMINNANNNPTTTATFIGNNIVVTLADDGTNPTGDMRDVISAIETADTTNRVVVRYRWPMNDETGPTGITPYALAQTNLSGAGDGSNSAVSATGTIGTVAVDKFSIASGRAGSGWNATTVVLTHNSFNGASSTTAVYNFSTNTLTISLKNNGSAITATIADIKVAVDSLSPSYKDENGRMMYDRLFDIQEDGVADTAVIAAQYSGTPMSGGVDGDYHLMPGWGIHAPEVGWRPDQGDTFYVERGQEWGSLWIYNDENQFVKQGAADATEANFISAYIGKVSVGNSMPAYSSTKVVSGGTSLTDAISALDARLGDNLKESKSAAVTAATTVDSVVMEQNLAVNWMVHVREVANPANIYTVNVFAAHDANTGLAATRADYNEAGILQFGNNIDGLDIGVDVETSGALDARLMRLRIASTDSVDVTVQRNPLRRVA
ncbi:MAG: hypothetical protein HQL75_00300 [Magnetococcales bacterium]|nr:hypothetical protein [Magnetococcales bacterium]